jgi:ATP-dependent Clp protease ATP-binding subunit ClpA
MRSSFVHVYHGTMDFTLLERLEESKVNLANEILAELKSCPYSLFVFDEVEKMPAGIFDAITSLLDYHGTVRGADITKAVFIFIGNNAAEKIVSTYQQMVNDHGMFRAETKLHHFEEIAKLGAYNIDGGLKNSQAIVQSVIDHYIPFLPLEREHIEKCIRVEFEKHGVRYVTEQIVEKIIRRFVAFDKNNLFAINGCKNLDKKIDMEAEEFLRELPKITHEKWEL